MMYLVATQAIVFIIDFILPEVSLSWRFMFVRPLIMQGEIWRVLSFIFLPLQTTPIFLLFAIYFYMMMGSGLEGQWGAFKFNIFYLCGMIGTIIAGFITGFATNTYLNLSIVFAFAILFPNFEIRLFLILPVKMKWIAMLSLIPIIFLTIFNTMSGRLAILASFLNIIAFFGKDIIDKGKRWHGRRQWNKNFK